MGRCGNNHNHFFPTTWVIFSAWLLINFCVLVMRNFPLYDNCGASISFSTVRDVLTASPFQFQFPFRFHFPAGTCHKCAARKERDLLVLWRTGHSTPESWVAFWNKKLTQRESGPFAGASLKWTVGNSRSWKSGAGKTNSDGKENSEIESGRRLKLEVRCLNPIRKL